MYIGESFFLYPVLYIHYLYVLFSGITFSDLNGVNNSFIKYELQIDV